MGYGTGLNRGRSGRIGDALADIGAMNGDRQADGLVHAEGIKGMHAAQWRVCTPFQWALYCGWDATGVLQTGKGGGI